LAISSYFMTITLVAKDSKENGPEHTQLALLNTAVQSLSELYDGIDVVGLWMGSNGIIQEFSPTPELGTIYEHGRNNVMPNNCTVSIVMGSKSDLETMMQAVKILKAFGISHEMRIMSAHRTPGKVHEFCQGVRERGVKVILAGAGKARPRISPA